MHNHDSKIPDFVYTAQFLCKKCMSVTEVLIGPAMKEPITCRMCLGVLAYRYQCLMSIETFRAEVVSIKWGEDA